MEPRISLALVGIRACRVRRGATPSAHSITFLGQDSGGGEGEAQAEFSREVQGLEPKRGPTKKGFLMDMVVSCFNRFFVFRSKNNKTTTTSLTSLVHVMCMYMYRMQVGGGGELILPGKHKQSGWW